MEQRSRPERSVKKYHYTLRKNPEERKSQATRKQKSASDTRVEEEGCFFLFHQWDHTFDDEVEKLNVTVHEEGLPHK